MNISGRTFNQLTVIRKTENKDKNGSYLYLCECSCGKTTLVNSSRLKNNTVKSCGCLKHKSNNGLFKDLTGKKFGKLIVLKRVENSNVGQTRWLCECECGTTKEIFGKHLQSQSIQSCGCIVSLGEKRIAELLTSNHIQFKKEFTFSDLKDKGLLRFDFAIFEKGELQCLIEFDGIQHFSNKRGGWNSDDSFEQTLKRDLLKNQYCEKNDIKIIRIKYTEIHRIKEILEEEGII